MFTPTPSSSSSSALPPTKDALLFDSEICISLGMSLETGMCLRHPNICVYESGKGSTTTITQPPSFPSSSSSSEPQQQQHIIINNNKKNENESKVHTCRICDSETKAGGGLQHRKSFAFAITEIKEIHGTPEWQKFKDNWGAEDTIEECGGVVGAGSGSDILCELELEEKKEIVYNEAQITFVADQAQAANSIETRNIRPSQMMRQTNNMPRLLWTRQVLQRVAQVAAWKTASQAAEMETMTREMERLKRELAKAEEAAVRKEADLEAVVAKQATDLETLQAKCDKQERHINKELRMIKTIAMKRASSRGSIGDSANSATNNNNNNNNNTTTTTNGATPLTTPISPVPSQTSGSSYDVAMKQPSRKMSGIHHVQSPTTTEATSDVTGTASTALPIRAMSGRDQQMSSLTLTDVSAFKSAKHKNHNHNHHNNNNTNNSNNNNNNNNDSNISDNDMNDISINLNDTTSNPYFSTNQFDLAGGTNQDKAPPSQPQRLPSHDTCTGITTVSDLTSSLVATEFVTGGHGGGHGGGSGDLSITFVPPENDVQRPLDIHQTTPSSVLTGGSSGRKYATKNVNGHLHDSTPSIEEVEDEEEESNSERLDRVTKTLQTPARRQKRADVSARPTAAAAVGVGGVGAANRRGRAKSDMTGQVSTAKNLGSAEKNKVRRASDQEISFFPTDAEAAAPPPPPPDMSPQQRSHEIEFDVSRDFATEGVDKRRKSLMGMKFDSSSQRLLMEASAALADPTMTPLSVSQRKTHSQSPAVAQHKQQRQQRMSQISTAVAHRDIDLGNSAAALQGGGLKDASFHDKTQEEILNEKIFGKVEKATPENELDDEYDYFEDLPSDLGLSNEGYLQVRNSVNLSPVSAITTGSMSYLMDNGPGGLDNDDDDDDDDDGPRKGLHQAGFAKRLPMEEDFDSDDDSKTGDNTNDDTMENDEDTEDSGLGGGGPPPAVGAAATAAVGPGLGRDDADDDSSSDEGQPHPVKLTTSHSGSQDTSKNQCTPPTQLKSSHPTQRHQLQQQQQQRPPSVLVKPAPQKSTDPTEPPAALRSLSEGFNKEGHHPALPHHQYHSRVPAATLHVENEIVQDKYGDGGMYTGNISTLDRLPHGNGKMAYDNERQYDGEWRKGRWHGIGKWVNPNGDCYEGTFVYDARHGRGTYTWKNGNVYKGDFHEDKRQGKGVFNFANGNIYEGDFINGVFEGQGKYSFEGGFYEGGWKGGRYHNHGFLKFADGSSYTGEFVDGVAHGYGEEKAADGTVRTGNWENGRPI